MLSDDYYEILGITRDATAKEIKQAYRRMIKRYHPDLNPDMPDAENCLRAVVIAYHTLSDKHRRADYDSITSLFGPKRKTPESTDQKRTGSRQINMSRLEQRNRESRRSVLVWLALVILLSLSFVIWVSVVSGGFGGRLRFSPVIYADMFMEQPSPHEVFKKEPVEDQWDLWYRTNSYRLFMGEWGSARELAVAYVRASEQAASRDDLVSAHLYASAATEIDPSYSKAVYLEKSLRLRLKNHSRL